MGIDDNTRAQQRKLKPLVDMAIGGALDAFYSKVQAAMHTRKFLSDIQHMEAAKARQKTLVHRHRVGVQRGLCQCCARRRLSTCSSRLGAALVYWRLWNHH
ncbi:MAG TPA: protoglobin domain-containing protein [Methylocella sp.]|nr:protoglobin domain-containing protein [Methylocella sp.]